MPVYDFECGDGHRVERLETADVFMRACHCGKPARRLSVYAHSSPRTYGSEYHHSPSVKEAMAETLGYKAEARAAIKEAVANGWKPKE